MHMMAYMSSIHDSTVEMPNKLMLGREIEVSLDATDFLAHRRQCGDN